jgi:oligoendopeptidase F
MAEKTLPLRSEVPKEHTWNAESVFADMQAYEAEFAAVVAEIEKAKPYQGTLANGAARLVEWMEFVETLVLRGIKLYFYATMQQACNGEDQAANALVGQAGGMVGQLFGTIAFSDPELIAIGYETLKAWMGQEDRLKIYAHSFDNLFRQQAHVRSAEVEELLGMLSDPFGSISNTFEMLTSVDMDFRAASGEKTVAQSTIDKLLVDPDREVRRTGWENYADEYLAHKNTLSASYSALIKSDVFSARARHHASSLEASLFANNIPMSVYENLLATFKKNLPIWHRYWRARRKALKVDQLHPYDIWAPLTSAEPKVSFEQAMEWISEGLAPLGEEYVSTMRKGVLEQRWVDRYPNKGKRQGAFSFGLKGTFPVIMMSYQGDLGSMSTLAHELGHSMHSYFTWQTQPNVYSDYSLFVAEVASNFNQAMTRAYLFNKIEDREFQMALIQEAMDNFHRYFFIMPTLARFEREAHSRVEQGQGLTSDSLIDLMADLFEEGYGGEMAIDRERIGITWAQFGHLYSPFYVYQYATGISGAHALAGRILAGEPNAASDYVNKFLKVGSSKYALEVMQDAGVDLSTPEPVEAAFKVLEGLVDRLEKLVE